MLLDFVYNNFICVHLLLGESMQIQEKSYTDWKDEAAHLTDEQFNKAGDLLLKGESGLNAIRMTENLVLPGDRKKYLLSKPGIYQIGWLNGESGSKDRVNASFNDELLFNQGYKECLENIENLKICEELELI
jgi:hypothetical protein